MSYQVDVWVADGSDRFAGPLRRPVRLSADGFACVVYAGVAYPLFEGNQINIAGRFWDEAEARQFLEVGHDLPYAPSLSGDTADVEDAAGSTEAAFPEPGADRWVDAFPWVQQVSTPRTVPWWESPIDSEAGLSHYPSVIADLAIEHLQGWSLGQVYPRLPLEFRLDQLDVPTRALNPARLYARHSDVLLRDLVTVRVGEMLQWRNLGPTTVRSLLQEFARSCVAPPSPLDVLRVTQRPTAAETVPDIGHSNTSDQPMSQWLSQLQQDATVVSEWYSAVGLPFEPLLASTIPPGTPPEVIAARHRLESLTAAEVLHHEDVGFDVSDMLDDILRRLNDRSLVIVSKRLFAEQRVTLDQLGEELGVTRERVRQLEKVARDELIELAASFPSLQVLVDALPSLIGGLCPLQTLIPKIPALRRRVDVIGQPAWFVLDRLDDAYEIQDGWCASPSIRDAKASTRSTLDELADQHGVVELSEMELFDTGDEASDRAFLEEWLDYCGVVVDDAFVLTRTSSIYDYSAAILSTAGAPMTTSQIRARMVKERSENSIRNQLGSDDRFVRVDRDTWALSEWGFDEFTNVRTAMRDAISQHGGSLRLNELVEIMTSRYSISANSVRTYASAPPFDLTEGIVSYGRTDHEVRKTPEQTRRVFRWPGAWAYRIKISGEHLRGSGSPAPAAIASRLGLQPGDSLSLTSSLGPQTLSWATPQPVFGTIRRFILDCGAEPDSLAFVVFGDDHSFRFKMIREANGDPLDGALSLVGAPPANDPEQARTALATALGQPEVTSLAALTRGYHQRGDADVALLLAEARSGAAAQNRY